MNSSSPVTTWPGAVIYLKDSKSDVWPEKGLTLERVSFAVHGSATFLTGYRLPSRKPGWWHNAQIWISADEIKSMFVYEDPSKWNTDQATQMSRWQDAGYDT